MESSIQHAVKISTMIVTYNTGSIVLKCIDSILSSDKADEIEIIVVDNQSTDNTYELIREQYPQVKLIKSDKNGGFSYGNNQALRVASGEFVALINPDLEVAPDTLHTLTAYLENNPQVGIVGPRTLSAEGDVTYTARPPYNVPYIFMSYSGLGRVFPGLMYGDTYDINLVAAKPATTTWLQGSCLVCSKSLLEEIGGMDEDYFLYAEDTDLCERIRQQNLEVVYIPTTTVVHIGGTSTAKASLFRVRSYHQSPIIFFRKHNKHRMIWLLKVFFTFELLGKSLLRRLRNLLHHDKYQAEQASIEVKIWVEMWRY